MKVGNEVIAIEGITSIEEMTRYFGTIVSIDLLDVIIEYYHDINTGYRRKSFPRAHVYVDSDWKDTREQTFERIKAQSEGNDA